jgi:hypothetical protein
VAYYFHPSKDLYHVSSKRNFTDFSFSGFVFSSLKGFISCLLRENFHGFRPQWLCIFIPQWIYAVSPQRELSRTLPSVALYFHPSEDLYHVSLERIFTDFSLSGLSFCPLVDFYRVSSERIFMDFSLSGLCIFIPYWIFIVSPHKELSRILPSLALYFHPLVDFYRVSSEITITDFSLSGFVFSSL